MVRPEGVQVSRFQNRDVKSSLSKPLSIQFPNISGVLDLTGVKKDVGKQYRETETTTCITVSGFFLTLYSCTVQLAQLPPLLT